MLDKSIVEPITNMVAGLGKTAENLATDKLTQRQKIDMTSAFRLPHLIRPISLLIGWGLTIVLDILIVIMALVKMEDPTAIIVGVSVTASASLTMMLKWYFQGRTKEKSEAKIAAANIEIKKMEIEAEIEMETMVLESEMDDEKLDRWVKKKEARKKRGLFNRNK